MPDLRQCTARRVAGWYAEDLGPITADRPSFVHQDVPFNRELPKHTAFPSLPLNYEGYGPTEKRPDGTRQCEVEAKERENATAAAAEEKDREHIRELQEELERWKSDWTVLTPMAQYLTTLALKSLGHSFTQAVRMLSLSNGEISDLIDLVVNETHRMQKMKSGIDARGWTVEEYLEMKEAKPGNKEPCLLFQVVDTSDVHLAKLFLVFMGFNKLALGLDRFCGQYLYEYPIDIDTYHTENYADLPLIFRVAYRDEHEEEEAERLRQEEEAKRQREEEEEAERQREEEEAAMETESLDESASETHVGRVGTPDESVLPLMETSKVDPSVEQAEEEHDHQAQDADPVAGPVASPVGSPVASPQEEAKVAKAARSGTRKRASERVVVDDDEDGEWRPRPKRRSGTRRKRTNADGADQGRAPKKARVASESDETAMP